MIAFLLLSLFFHSFVDTVSLDGAWEMAYQPYEYSREVITLPQFEGKIVENAVPGYWEDLFDANDGYRIHPLYHKQSFPITVHAEDMTLPNIYGAFFYRRTVTLDRDGEAVLRFTGVRNQVHVWINGKFVAFRQGFSTPFELTVRDGILRKGENTIVMAVSNNPNLGYSDYVSGMTTRSVFGGTGGVEGHLELAFLRNDLGDVYVTTAADLKTFTVHVSGHTPYEWSIPGVGVGSTEGDLTLPTDGLRFWSPEDPFLYELTMKADGKEFRQKFGIRRLTAEGEKLFLNGKPIYLRGVTEHCYYPQTVHLSRDIEYYRMVCAKRKELGFNFVRLHTHILPEEFFQACDEAGLMVHVESPNYVDVPEYRSIVAFARRHPSAVIYCTGNETRIDLMAEAYLKEISDLVHSATDALFSPMSALRGLEYALYEGRDVIVPKPWPHNPERIDRVAQFSDLFTSYQLGAASYTPINSSYTTEVVDEWGDIYKRPRISHEICIQGTYVDFSTEDLYPKDSPILKIGMFEGLRNTLAEKGLLDRADLYYLNSCEWQRRCRKFCFEKVRSMKRTMGYDFLGDINTHGHTTGYSCGIMDEFYRMKPSESVENVLRYNSPAVLLNDLGSDVNFKSGQTKSVGISISNFADEAQGGVLTVKLCDERGKAVFTKTFDGVDAPLGEVTALARADVGFPSSRVPHKYLLKAEYAAGTVCASNEWEVYSFPEAPAVSPSNVKVVQDITEEELLAAMDRGERIVLFGLGPFQSQGAMSFDISLPGRSAGATATVIKAGHPALGNFPNDGFCGWQFRRLVEGAAPVMLESGVPFDPVIDVASAVKNPIRQSVLFEYSVGKGKLLVCTLKFSDNDPAAAYLKSRILSYASSGAFRPEESISPSQVSALISQKKISSVADTNRAYNVNDPSSLVRAGESSLR